MRHLLLTTIAAALLGGVFGSVPRFGYYRLMRTEREIRCLGNSQCLQVVNNL